MINYGIINFEQFNNIIRGSYMEIKNNEVKIITQITYDIYKKCCRFSMFKGK